MNQINFECTLEDVRLIAQIVKRAHVSGLFDGFPQNPMDTGMDITACHCNGCPLDMKKLLAADDFNLAHDLLGIRRHIDRTTGKLRKEFSPRCSLSEPVTA